MKREATSTALVAEAIHTGKLLLKWNPGDNRGVRTLLCNWMLEAGDTAARATLARKAAPNFYAASVAFVSAAWLTQTCCCDSKAGPGATLPKKMRARHCLLRSGATCSFRACSLKVRSRE